MAARGRFEFLRDRGLPDLDESSEDGADVNDAASEFSDFDNDNLDDDTLKCGNCGSEASTADISSGEDGDAHTSPGGVLPQRQKPKAPANAGLKSDEGGTNGGPITRKSPRRLQKKVKRRRAKMQKVINEIRHKVLKMTDSHKAAVIRACATLIGTDGENVDVPDAPIHGLGEDINGLSQMFAR